MSLIPESELADLRARQPVATVAGRWVRLRADGKRFVGPCPLHSPDPQASDSTSFAVLENGSWVCATCCDGGDVIKLVRLREGLGFREAVAWLGGTQAVDQERAATLERDAKAAATARDQASDYFRDRERQKLWDIWTHAEREWQGTPVADYLALRGLAGLPATVRLRCVPDMPFFIDRAGGAKTIAARAPCMIAPILRPDRRFGGLHLTYIDLRQPKGKLAVIDPASGEPVPGKGRKSRGSTAGGHIELLPLMPPAMPRQLIIGEGIEKVLAVYLALAAAGADLSASVFRTSIDLGNLGGRAAGSLAHPDLLDRAGKARRVQGPIAELTAPGIPLEDTIADGIILADSTSDRFTIECAIARAAQRWAADGRSLKVAWPPENMDFDDLLRGNGGHDGHGEART